MYNNLKNFLINIMDNNLIYIYKNINKIKNHNDIIKYIKLNDIKYSLNNNGFFVNISCLSEEHILNIYNILNYYMNNKKDNKIFIDKREKLISEYSKIVKIDKNNYNLPLSDFNEWDQKIIQHSKQYKI